MKKKQERKVLAFGTFDHLHPGHIHFLNEAKRLGNLTVSVATDQSVVSRKKNKPSKNTTERIKNLDGLKIADKIIAGDKSLGNWSIIKKINPDIIAIGYDQKELKMALAEAKKRFGLKFLIKNISSKNPEKYHSSILKNSKSVKNHL